MPSQNKIGRVFEFARKYRRLIVAAVLLTVLLAGMAVVPPLMDYYHRHMADGTFVSWLAVDGDRIIGTIEAALARARNVAAPINTARLGCDTPCRLDGVCHNCNSPQCICNYVHFTRNSFPAHRHTVILIGETWGY